MAKDSGEQKPGGWMAPGSAMRAKLHAWWEGYDYAEKSKPDAGAPPTQLAAAEPPPAIPEPIHPDPIRLPMDGKVIVKDAWPPERMKVAQMVWGDGFTFPGGERLALELGREMGLPTGAVAMDLGCGLGGGTRAMARELELWMEGYDLSIDLARAGDGSSRAANMERKAPIGLLDVVDGSFKPKRYDGAVVRNVFSLVSEKPKLLTRIRHGMKPGGRLVIADWAISHDDAMGPDLEAYRLGEATAPRLSTIERFVAQLAEAGFEVQAKSDITDAFRAAVLEGWARIDGIVARGQLVPAEGQALVDEAQLWSRRIAALAGGELRFAKLVAARPSE